MFNQNIRLAYFLYSNTTCKIKTHKKYEIDEMRTRVILG